MHAYTTYHFEISGAEENIRAIGEVLKSKITDVEYESGSTF